VKSIIFSKPQDYEIDILSPIRGTYQNSNLFYFPKSYKRLEKIVRMYPANKFDTLNANTTFITMSEEDKGALRIIARSFPSFTSGFENIMDFTTGQLTFKSNFRGFWKIKQVTILISTSNRT
jgi:hypothetical protein